MPVADAKKFLTLLDKDEEMREQVRRMTHLSELGKKHHLDFNSDDLEKALKSKWGIPEKREKKAHPFTCCCG